MDFMVYQMDVKSAFHYGKIEDEMDVKSAFHYGKIEDEVYFCHPPGFEDPNFPDKVYKVKKCKKKIMVANSTTEAEYVVASSYRGQVLWIQNQLLDYGFIQTFLDKQLDGLPTHKEKYDVSFHNKKVFANMKRIGKGFFGKETPLFPTMVGPNQVQMGEGSAQPTDTQHTPTFDMPPPKPKKTQKPRQPKRKTTKVPQPSESTDIATDKSFFSAAETIVTIALTTTAESTKTNVKESTKKDKAETVQENISKRAGDELDQERSKKQKVEADKESEELQKCLEIIPNDGDEVTIDATPLSFKSPTIVDYKIYKERKKKYFQIFKADGNSQMYLTFSKLLKNFDREDLEVLWSLVKDRFLKTKPVDDMYSFILHTLKIMFEHRVEDNV
nr:ribonuclease H-like domain-containing protein [Tanacetum cinerariifolium]